MLTAHQDNYEQNELKKRRVYYLFYLSILQSSSLSVF